MERNAISTGTRSPTYWKAKSPNVATTLPYLRPSTSVLRRVASLGLSPPNAVVAVKAPPPQARSSVTPLSRLSTVLILRRGPGPCRERNHPGHQHAQTADPSNRAHHKALLTRMLRPLGSALCKVVH